MSRFPEFEAFKPPMPTLRDERVALKVATELVITLNLDDFYWSREELNERIAEMQAEIVLQKEIKFNSDLLRALQKRSNLWVCDLLDHLEHLGAEVSQRILTQEIESWRERYQISEAL